jgi:hypothetical protein
MRHAIIEDITRNYSVELASEVYGPEAGPGYLVVEHCPVKGIYVWPKFYSTPGEARASLNRMIFCEE